MLMLVVQVIRRDPLARLTEALREHKVSTSDPFWCNQQKYGVVRKKSTKCLKKLWFCFRLVKQELFQVVHQGKEGTSVTLACAANQQVWIHLIMVETRNKNTTPKLEQCRQLWKATFEPNIGRTLPIRSAYRFIFQLKATGKDHD